VIVVSGPGNGASLSMGALFRGTWRGGGSFSRALKGMKGRLWGWASLFMEAQLGNLEWAHLLGTLEEECLSLSVKAL